MRLSPASRRLACEAIVETLHENSIDVVAVCVDDHHFHALARFRDHRPRFWIGQAKRASARALSLAGLAQTGGVWAVRSRAEPIKDRAHQVTVAKYILRHASRGAATWRVQSPGRGEWRAESHVRPR